MKITFVTVSTTAIRELLKAEKAVQSRCPGTLELKLVYAARSMTAAQLEEMRREIAGADAVLVDLMGSPADVVAAVYAALEECKGQIIPYGQSGRAQMRLGRLTAAAMPMGKGMGMGEPKQMTPAKMRRMTDMAEVAGKVLPVGIMRDMRNLSQLAKYFRTADAAQLENMLCLILRDYGGHKQLPKPEPAREVPVIGICHPAGRQYYEDYEAYAAAHGYDAGKPTVALLYYGHTYPDDTAPCVAAIMEKLEKQANLLPIAFGGTTAENYGQLRQWLTQAAGKPVDAVLNFMSFRLGAGPMGGDADGATDILKEVNAPYLHPFFMTRRRVSEWRESEQGLNANEFLISVMLPELDGCIEAIPVGAMSEPSLDENIGIELRGLSLIEERAERLAARLGNLLELRRKPNKEKKIAIIGYNYPPGEDNIFSGSFLDTFASMENILSGLKQDGYDTQALSAERLMEKFAAGRIVNSGSYAADEAAMLRYPLEKYREKLAAMPDRDEIVAEWGEPPGALMTAENNDFLIPGIVSGNVFIGLQPSRGIHEDPEKAYHDKALPPHHQYIAFYTWLREEFGADAIIHVGTHGTLEFLKGKECGMSGGCFPDRLIASMPHVYLYYTGNPSEAMIAKRRAHANLISYQPPPYVPGRLYGDYAALSAAIDEYREAQRVSPARSDDILKKIRQSAAALNLPPELDELERELYRMHRSLIPSGLHVFGRGYDEAEAREYARGLLRYDRDGVKSLLRLAAEADGLDYDALLAANDTAELAALDEKAAALFAGEVPEGIGGDLKKDLARTLAYAGEITAASRHNAETAGLRRVLNGQYNPARLAGDIYRNPEVLPAGYNLYQFDPRFVPSPTASERGKKIAEATLEQYKKDNNGALPASTAVILWGLETSRTQGETVAQILAYLGVRAARGGSVWEPKFEIIPLEELGRPRVDVVVNMCGFFRDMFPNIIENLNRVFGELAELDEPDDMNRFKANAAKIYQTLLDRGYAGDEAKELSRARIFGPGEGQYGTGITGIIETRNWEREEQIGEEFVRKLRYVYSKHYRGRDVAGLLDDNLKSVDIVSQIRSSHEYEITDLDHYYEFFGGLAKSVEMAKGKKARMYITDTTGESIVAEGVEKAIGRGIRTRVLNPRWIDGMLAHNYHGVQKIAERFENVMGLAATTSGVEPWVYDDLHGKYIADEEMRRRLKENNPYAYLSIVEQMLEYQRRGYWDASEEQLEQLREVFLELEGDIEENL